MAFRHPQHHAPQRTYTQPETEFAIASPASEQRLNDSQEWIVFSAVPASSTANLTHTTSTEKTGQTAGRSHLSHYGSTDTATRSYDYEIDESEHTEEAIEEEEEDEADHELDSLDSHLMEFREESNPSYIQSPTQEQIQASGNSVLPTHDGLGSFQLDRTAMGNAVQEQIYAFERHNPRRAKKRKESLKESLDLAQLEPACEDAKERERMKRIEEWRLEQSRALLDEVQKETKRRRRAIERQTGSYIPDHQADDLATMGSILEDPASSHLDKEPESFWSRITRRVIQDLMGIDDRLLSLIFGESLPEEFEKELSATYPSTQSTATIRVNQDDAWENRLLERIAKELGLLVHQLSEHPGAFTAYQRMQQEPIPYAGLPIIPEASPDFKESPLSPVASVTTPLFHPTIPAVNKYADPISESRHYFDQEMDYTPQPAAPAKPAASAETPTEFRDFTKDDWEKQLDIGLVFRYLRSRFSSRKASHPALQRHATSPQDAAARAARVRQHHPLVNGAGRPKTSERRPSYRVVIPPAGVVSIGAGAAQRRRSSSCASQSTKKSGRRASGSSRCYWDVGCGGSLGSGSLIVSTGGMGGWGDV